MLTDYQLNKAYTLLISTLRAKSKAKLEASGRGIWTRKMIESIDAKIVMDGDGDLAIEILGESYQDFIDQGVNGVGFQKTKSGKMDKRFKSNRSVVTGSPFSYKDKKPPIDAITPWAKAKGISPWAVQTSIYTRGIKGIHFFADVLDEEMDNFLDYLAEAEADSLLNDFAEE